MDAVLFLWYIKCGGGHMLYYDVLHIIKSLRFPLGEYVVTGGAVFAVRGMREAADIDIIGSTGLIKKLSLDPTWKRKIFVWGWWRGRKCYQKGGVIEVFSDQNYRWYKRDLKDLIKSADVIDGVPFVNLTELFSFKLALGRNKDKTDLFRIFVYYRDYDK